ncbi:MAG TPA: neutral/alkaline non-lysosomal ceramidase N-terminal domain-containing protein [Bryobacteraceae bacterium]|nr:neutral/alkaline non-lysosomal ceramidase N-terminal domain-containing protein [Bryobacteraceae bacterium]
MKPLSRIVAVLALCASAPWAFAAEVELRAGTARVEITPPSLMEMYGYARRKCGPANGTHDPLYAKALVLATGDTRVAIVTMDIGSIVSPDLSRRVREELGIPVLLLAASHTHSGPKFLPYGGEEVAGGAAFLKELEPKLFALVQQAAKEMFPARLAYGRGALQLGYNRLLPRDDGRSRALFENPDRIPYGPVDPEFMLLRVEDASGAPRALMVHYATHAVVLGPTNCKYSADYPGVLQARVEAAVAGVQCMFVQGGAGDVNPLFLARTGNEEQDFAQVSRMGELLANAVLRANKDLKPAAPMLEPIRHTSAKLNFPDRWEKDKSLDVGITTVLINREIAIATIPGEPLHKLQTMWKSQADVPFPLFYGYTYNGTGGWAGYIPDLRSAAYGGYGADASTRIEVGAGEAIMNRHLIQLYGLRDMWQDKPGRN